MQEVSRADSHPQSHAVVDQERRFGVQADAAHHVRPAVVDNTRHEGKKPAHAVARIQMRIANQAVHVRQLEKIAP